MSSISSRDTSSVRFSKMAPATAPVRTSAPITDSTRICQPCTVSFIDVIAPRG
jgi:hypothetical protein